VLLSLENGPTFCLQEGPKDGPTLLLIHGATVPSWEFDRLVPHLHQVGWQTIRVDLYGHGQSARPLLDYTVSLLSGQVCEALEHLNRPPRVAVLGHSLGAVVGADLVRKHPEIFTHLILVAPMLDFVSGHPWARLLSIPVLGEGMMKLLVMPLLRRRRRQRYTAIGVEEFILRFEKQIALPGFDQALLSLFRCRTLADQEAIYAECGRRSAQTPKLLVWGDRDHVVSREHLERIRSVLGPHECVVMSGLEHNLFITHPQEVATHLLSFLAQELPTTHSPGSLS